MMFKMINKNKMIFKIYNSNNKKKLTKIIINKIKNKWKMKINKRIYN